MVIGGNMKIAKCIDGRIVSIVRMADTVGFSTDRGWICICIDFDKVERKREQFKWVPAGTVFTWVRDYVH